MTALHLAAKFGRYSVVKLLVEAGVVDINVKVIPLISMNLISSHLVMLGLLAVDLQVLHENIYMCKLFFFIFCFVDEDSNCTTA